MAGDPASRLRVLSGLTIMRALLTGGIKAILAIAALSTAAHWALRVQREAPAPIPAVASLPEPTTTGSIEPRRIERPALPKGADLKASDLKPLEGKTLDPKAAGLKLPDAKARQTTSGLDQMHLSALIAGTTAPTDADRPKAQKPAPKR